jgi:hypothetical protein
MEWRDFLLVGGAAGVGPDAAREASGVGVAAAGFVRFKNSDLRSVSPEGA